MREFCAAIVLYLLWHFSTASADEYLDNGLCFCYRYVRTYKIANSDESLIELARKFDLGYNEIAYANPDLDPFVPGEGKSVVIPSSWILPDVGSKQGIVIDLTELRLYFFVRRGGKRHVATFPIGIGSEGPTLLWDLFSIVDKVVIPPGMCLNRSEKKSLNFP